MKAPHYRLVIPNELSAIRNMSEWLDASMREMGVGDDLVFKFDLCANEAVTNIISYGYTDALAHEIALSISLEDDKVSLEIEDDGQPFNPLESPEHAQPASLEEAEIGGVGIDLIRKFMDECRYRRDAGKNIFQMLAVQAG